MGTEIRGMFRKFDVPPAVPFLYGGFMTEIKEKIHDLCIRLQRDTEMAVKTTDGYLLTFQKESLYQFVTSDEKRKESLRCYYSFAADIARYLEKSDDTASLLSCLMTASDTESFLTLFERLQQLSDCYMAYRHETLRFLEEGERIFRLPHPEFRETYLIQNARLLRKGQDDFIQFLARILLSPEIS